MELHKKRSRICHITNKEDIVSEQEAMEMFEALSVDQKKQIIFLLRTLASQQAQSPSVLELNDNTKI